MFRTQIYLTESECIQLNALSKTTGKCKSALIRDAIDRYISFKKTAPKTKPRPAAGLWAKRKDLPDYTKLRDEFER
jgi:hypothetical protein